eukprot:TRINITY_DN7150_c0_g1_i1.p1 TRINITY_DN7150_c0_g1~~TRINITY_DN7150_c0_g1_i1.p1  ORF type:complete len:579 (+),score=61.09 TRINITY_DN7150_c0_g1_i1:103-1839(+)
MKRRTQIIKIGIVGGGPSGLAAAWQLSRKFLSAETLRTLPLDSRDRVEIHLYEKRPSIGPSTPWATDVEPKVARVHTIHFFASSIMLDPAEPDAFIRWALGEEEKCTCEGSCDPERRRQFSRSFPARATVGEFFARQAQVLRESLEDHIQGKNSSKFHVKLFEHTEVEVTNIHTPNMIEYRSVAASGTESPTKTSSRRLSEPFSYLIIATGHIPSRSTAASTFLKTAPALAKSRYIDQLFPITSLDQNDPGATVGIIGAHLTGVDAALALKARGHTGRIIMASRTGVLPEICPRNEFPAEPYQLQRITKASIETYRMNNPKASLKDAIIELTKQEFEIALGKTIDWSNLVKPENPFDRLRRSLHHYNTQQTENTPPPQWQMVIFSLYRAIMNPEQLRWIFDDPEFSASWFYEGLGSIWSGYSLWMTAERAQELLDMYDAGQLQLIAPLDSISSNADGTKPVLVSSVKGDVEVDWIINAANGSPHINEVTREDSELWCNLRDEGKLMLLKSRPGNSGFGIEKNTYKLLSSQLQSTYIIGGPMVWFTSDVSVVAMRTKAVVNAITKDFVIPSSPTLPRPS